MSDRRLRVDPIACDAHGICAEMLPELIRLDDWGYPIIADEEIGPELMHAVRRAIASCPVLALRLEVRHPRHVRTAAS